MHIPLGLLNIYKYAFFVHTRRKFETLAGQYCSKNEMSAGITAPPAPIM